MTALIAVLQAGGIAEMCFLVYQNACRAFISKWVTLEGYTLVSLILTVLTSVILLHII